MPATRISKMLKPFFQMLERVTPWFDLFARCWVGYVFFHAGLIKLTNWEQTLALFHYDYQVPLLSPWLAAVLGTGFELILPILLVIGFGGRLIIFSLFVYNVIVMLSFPMMWTPEGLLARDQHINWGLLLALLMCHGSGKLSLDYVLRKRYGHLL